MMVEKEIKLQLKYNPKVTEEELIGRVMGPDAWGAFYYVVAVMKTDTHTVANFMPLPVIDDEHPIIQDPFDMSGMSTRVAF